MATILSRQTRRIDNSDNSLEPQQTLSQAATNPVDASKQLAGIFKLLADETRLQILLLLYDRQELNVRALCDLLAQSQPAVSHHLALLKTDGLIECRRDGKHNYYHILPQRIQELVDTVFHVLPRGKAANGTEAMVEPSDQTRTNG